MVQLPQISQLSMKGDDKFHQDYRKSGASTSERVVPVGRLDVALNDVDTINTVSFCPYQGAEQLLVCGTNLKGKLIILHVGNSNGKLEVNILDEIEIGDEVLAISWSPETQVLGSHAVLKMAVSLLNEKEVQVITSQFRHQALLPETVEPNEASERMNEEWADVESIQFQVCKPVLDDLNLKEVINDVAFEPNTGEYLAAVGHDKVCVVWDSQELQPVARFTLTSPGLNVRWCPTDPNRLLVAEKCGVIRMYDLDKKMPVFTFLTLNNAPLTCMDWCRSNDLIVTACVGSETLFWQTSVSGLPIDRLSSMHKGASQVLLFNQNLLATRSRSRSQVVVFNRRLNQILLEDQLNAGNGLAWHAKQPILAAGAYGKIVLFQLNAYT